MTNGKLKIGVIGLGLFGESHLNAFRAIHHTEVVAVASRSLERAKEIAVRFDVPRFYDDYHALIADPAVEAISVTTAETDHRDPVLAALAAGKPVLVEKPMASTSEDAQAMVDAARQSRATLMPGHLLRFEPKFAALKNAVASGELGEITAISARRNRPRALVASHGRINPALATAIHDIDIMLWLTGSRVATVRAHHRLGAQPGDHHGIWALMRLENGVIVTIESAWMTPDGGEPASDDAFSVVGRKGMARVHFDVPAMWVTTAAGLRAPDVSFEPRINGFTAGALKEELSHFASCVLSGTPPDVAPEAGFDALSVALAMIDSASQDRELAVTRPSISAAL